MGQMKPRLAALVRTTLLISLAAVPPLLLQAQTTCRTPIGIYPSLSSVLLDSPFKTGIPSTQMYLSTNNPTLVEVTVSNIQSAGGWLSVVVPASPANSSASSFTASLSQGRPLDVIIRVRPDAFSSLASGQQYTGQFTVTSPLGAPIVIPVTLNLGPTLNQTSIPLLSQNCVSFTRNGGFSLQQIYIISSGRHWTGAITLSVDPVSGIVARSPYDGAWMQSSNYLANELSIELSGEAGLLPSGNYSGKINFTGSPSFTIPVMLAVPQGLAISPAALEFKTIDKAQQALNLTGGTGPFFAGVQSTVNPGVPGGSGRSGWLSVSPSGANLNSPLTLTVSVDPTGLAAEPITARSI
jgi:hypothetical protein